MVMWGGVRAWLITRYAEARALLNDPRLSKDQARALTLFPPGTDGPHASSLNVNMLLKDPPDHTRLRRAGQQGLHGARGGTAARRNRADRR